MASSQATNTNIETITVSDSSHLLNVNMTNVTKLTASNFLMWSRQVHALLEGNDLVGYLDGTVIMPPQTVTIAGVVTVNIAYTLWKRQDKLIYSAFLGAITASIQPLLSTTTTSAQIWEKLSSTYAKPSRGHILELKEQIKHWKKGVKSIREYFQGLTTRFDQLGLLGKAINHEDQVEYILEGLPEDYKQIVDQIESRDSPPSLTKVHEKILNHEVKLQAAILSSPSLPISANVANYRGPSNNNHYRQNGSRNNNRGSG